MFLSGSKLFVTGNNNRGQLGLGDTTNRNIFTLVDANSSFNAVYGGYNYLLAVSGKTLYGSGTNTCAALGLPSLYTYTTLTPILSSKSNISKLSTKTSSTYLSSAGGFNYINGTKTLPGLTGWFWHRRGGFQSFTAELGYPKMNMGESLQYGKFSVYPGFTKPESVCFLKQDNQGYIGFPYDRKFNITLTDAGTVYTFRVSGFNNNNKTELEYIYKGITNIAEVLPINSPVNSFIGNTDYTVTHFNTNTSMVTASFLRNSCFGKQLHAGNTLLYVAAPLLSGSNGNDYLSAGGIFVYTKADLQPYAIIRPGTIENYLFGNKMKGLNDSIVVATNNVMTVFNGAVESYKYVDTDEIAYNDVSRSEAAKNYTIIVGGQPSFNSNNGRVCVLNLSGGSQLFNNYYLIDSQVASPGNAFGYSVHQMGDYLAVGAPYATVKGLASAGRVDMYKLSATNNNLYRYVLLGSLSASTPSRQGFFGKTVHFDQTTNKQYLSGELYYGDSLLVTSNSGSYIFYKHGDSFVQTLSSNYKQTYFNNNTLLNLLDNTLGISTAYQTASSTVYYPATAQ
jgi:hypothetical protein